MEAERIKILKDFTASAEGRRAINDLLQALMKDEGLEGDIFGQIMAENDFLLKVKAITGEGPYDCITGDEEKAHYLLRSVLVEQSSGGREALRALKRELEL